MHVEVVAPNPFEPGNGVRVRGDGDGHLTRDGVIWTNLGRSNVCLDVSKELNVGSRNVADGGLAPFVNVKRNCAAKHAVRSIALASAQPNVKRLGKAPSQELAVRTVGPSPLVEVRFKAASLVFILCLDLFSLVS